MDIFNILTLIYLWWIYSLLIFIPKKKYEPFSPPVSVVIPCYNEKYDYLKKCVDSVINVGD